MSQHSDINEKDSAHHVEHAAGPTSGKAEDVVHRHNVVYAAGEEHPTTLNTYLVTLWFTWAMFSMSTSLSITTSQSSFIAADVGGSATAVAWFGSSGLVASACGFPGAYYVSDKIGRKKLMMIGFALLTIGMAIGGSAKSAPQIIAGVALSGLGVGFAATLLVGITDVVPVKDRGFFLGILDIAGGLSTAAGPLLGGALTTKVGWRYCFWFICAMCGAGGLAGLFIFNPKQIQEGSTRSILKKLDWLGIFILDACLILTLVGLVNSTNNPWSSKEVLIPFIIGLALMPAFGIYCKVKKDPICSGSLFTFFNFPMIMIVAWLSGWLLYGFTGFLPAMLALFYQAGALRSGVLNMVQNGVYMVVCPLSAMSVTWTNGSFRPLMAFGFAAGAIGAGLCSLIKPTDSIKMFLGFSVFLGISNGAISSMSLVITQYSALQKDLGIAVGMSNAARSFGGALSIAIFSTVLSTQVTKNIPLLVPAALIQAGLPATSIAQAIPALLSGNPAAIAAVPGLTPEAAAAGGLAILNSYRAGFRLIFIITAAFLCVGFFVVCAMHPIKPERMTKVVPVELGGLTDVNIGGVEKVPVASERDYARHEKV